MWMVWLAALLAVGYLVLKFLVKPVLKVIGIIALLLVAYFWLWPLLTNSH